MPGVESATSAGFAIGEAPQVLDAMIRHSGDCVHVVDLDGRVIRWNAACEQVYGWSAKAAMGQALPFVSPERRRRVLHDIRMLAGSETVTERVGTVVRPDGSQVRIHMSVIPVRDDEGDPSGVAVIAREILADDRHERQRDEFAAYIGERLAAPLNVIANAATLLSRPEVADDAVRRHKLAATLQTNARKAAEFVDDLLTITLASDARLVLDREPADVGEVVSAAVSELGEDSRRVVMEFDPLIGLVLADRDRLARVFKVLAASTLAVAGADGRVHVSVAMRGDVAEVCLRAERGTSEAAPAGERILSGQTPEARVAERLVAGVVEAHGGSVAEAVAQDGAPAVTVRLPAEHLAPAAGGPLW